MKNSQKYTAKILKIGYFSKIEEDFITVRGPLIPGLLISPDSSQNGLDAQINPNNNINVLNCGL